MPLPISPTTSSSTVTLARLTRWSTRRIAVALATRSNGSSRVRASLGSPCRNCEFTVMLSPRRRQVESCLLRRRFNARQWQSLQLCESKSLDQDHASYGHGTPLRSPEPCPGSPGNNSVRLSVMHSAAAETLGSKTPSARALLRCLRAVFVAHGRAVRRSTRSHN